MERYHLKGDAHPKQRKDRLSCKVNSAQPMVPWTVLVLSKVDGKEEKDCISKDIYRLSISRVHQVCGNVVHGVKHHSH